MVTTHIEQGLSQLDAPGLTSWARSFLTAKRAEGRAQTTVKVYAAVLSAFFAFCIRQRVTTLEAIDPNLLREYLLSRAGAGCSPADVHKHYRALRTWLRWYEAEAAPDGWRNPIARVKAPKLPEQALDPAPLDVLAELVKLAGSRDRAILLTLLDTGLRASELTALDVADFDQAECLLTVRRGKGGKARIVPLGTTGRRAVRRWLRERPAGGSALFCTDDGARLTYWGLRQVVRRLAERAGLPAPALHGIRRAFALGMLRAGVDLLTLSRLMGHSGLSLLARYAKQSTGDLRAAVERASLADRL
jgi:site-specific recombinase XerD